MMDNSFNAILMGKRLRACRLARHETMGEFSELCGISERYLADIERGLKVPKLETFIRIANAAEVSIEYLLQDSLLSANRDGLIFQALNGLSPKQKTLFQDFIIQLTDTLS